MAGYHGVQKAPAGRAWRWPLTVEFCILLALILVAPYATSFLPYEEGYDRSVGSARNQADPAYNTRVALIMVGIAAGILCFILAVVATVASRRLEVATLAAAIVLLAFDIGWRLMPYWAAGIFRATGGTQLTSIYDPKDFVMPLIPITWFRTPWYTAAISCCFAYAAFVPLIILGAIVSIWKGKKEFGLATVGLVLLLVAAWLSASNYFYWLLD
ncbi:MAG: hypothetical protein ACYTBJ_04730 [Planctomycetota bacterium]|jgi:hypothetical protein